MTTSPAKSATLRSLNAGSTIAEAAHANGDLSILASVLDAASLGATLASPGPFTVFAPTNSAFSKLPQGEVDRLLLPENRVELTSFVARHIIAGRMTSAELRERAHDSAGRTTLRNVDNDLIEVEERDDGLHLTAARGAHATLLSTDLPASNGVIHVTDAVLGTVLC